MDKFDGPDANTGESRPPRSSRRAPRKPRTGGNRVVGRSSATPTDMAREALSPEIESGQSPTSDSPPPTRGLDRPVADRYSQASAAVRAADSPDAAAPGEAEALAALDETPDELAAADEAMLRSLEERRRVRIAERAYYRAEQRGFAPGGELQDWLEAESEVDRDGNVFP